MKKYDLIIVGAGPAGSTAAYYTKNLKTLIIDRLDFPRPKACGGGLMSSRDWHLEFENFAKIETQLDRFPSNSIRFYWNNKYISKRKFKHLFDQVDRFQFDYLLLEEALKKTNVSFLRFNLENIAEENIDGEAGFILKSSNTEEEEIFARRLIGADGIYSQVSKFLGNRKLKRHQYGACLEYDLVCQKISNDVIVVPGFEKEIGYGWVFPTQRGYQVGIGLTRKTRKSIQHHLDSFFTWTTEKNIIPKDYSIKKISGANLPLSIPNKYATKNIMLAGDALGLVKILTGEGIYYAMKSGKIAGQTASKNPENFKIYKKFISPLIREVRTTPYIPPKIFTITFWSLFFNLGKYLEKISLLNPLIDHFIRSITHRSKENINSFYQDEEIVK